MGVFAVAVSLRHQVVVEAAKGGCDLGWAVSVFNVIVPLRQSVVIGAAEGGCELG